MATRTRSAAHDVPQWSVAIREQRSPAESRRGRVVANNAQLVVLRALYNRTGDNPTKEDVEEVVRETGLEAKWVRKWIKRQRGKTKRRNSSDSNSGSVSADLTVPRRLHSPEETAAATMPPPVPQPPVDASVPSPQVPASATTPAPAARAPVSLTFWAAPENPNATAGSGPAPHYPAAYNSAPPMPAAQPAAFRPPYAAAFQPGPSPSGTTFDSGDNFSHGAAYSYNTAGPSRTAPYPSSVSPMDPLAGQPGLPAASFSVPLRPQSRPYETYPGAPLLRQVPTAFNASPPVVPLQHADPLYESLTGELHPSVALPPAPPSPVIPATIAPTELSLQNFVPPGGLTDGAAYLYEIFHGSTAASEAAPPEAPAFNSVFFLPGLTRPSDVPPDLRAPVAAFASPTDQGYAGAGPAYPLSYQMPLSDLVALTKAIRLASVPPAPERTRSHVQEMNAARATSQGGRAKREVFDAGQPLSPNTTVSPSRQENDARDVPVGPSEPMPTISMQDGDETEDEPEVVTPCENTNFDLSFGLQANYAAKKILDGAVDRVGTGLVEVADATMDA